MGLGLGLGLGLMLGLGLGLGLGCAACETLRAASRFSTTRTGKLPRLPGLSTHKVRRADARSPKGAWPGYGPGYGLGPVLGPGLG